MSNSEEIEDNVRKERAITVGALGAFAGAILAPFTAGLTLLPAIFMGGGGGAIAGLFAEVDSFRYIEKTLIEGFMHLDNQCQQLHQKIVEGINQNYYRLSIQTGELFSLAVASVNNLIEERDHASQMSPNMLKAKMDLLTRHQGKLEDLTQQV